MTCVKYTIATKNKLRESQKKNYSKQHESMSARLCFALMEVNNPHMVYTQLKLAYILKTGGFMNTYSTQ